MVAGLASFGEVDWAAPWFTPYARRLGTDWRDTLNREAQERGICTAGGHRLRFAPAEAAGNAPYEAHIAATGEVPTRDDPHDVFSALVWLAWPRSKARLNQLQAAAIARDGIGARRGPLRDAATLLDENGALVVGASAPLAAALREHQWTQAFVGLRSDWDTVRVIVFGHALLQKLARPYKAVTAHAIFLPGADDDQAVDPMLASWLSPALKPRDMTPLPLAGVPGWHSDNADPSFYEDTAVFRRSRALQNRGETSV